MELRRWYSALFPLFISALILVGCAKRPSMVQASAPPPAGAVAAGVSTAEESGEGNASVGGNEATARGGGSTEQGAAAAGQVAAAPPGATESGASSAGAGQVAASSSEGGAAGAAESGATAGAAGQSGAGTSEGGTEGGATGGGTTVTGPAGLETAGGPQPSAASNGSGTAAATGGGTTVTGPAGPEAAGAAESGEQMIAAARPALKEYAAVPELEDVHFEFDRYSIRVEDAKVLNANAQWLKSNPNYLVLIEGHCDERGTNEYNIALGQHRAKSAMDYLVSQGVQASRITTISYGEERPLCAEHTEECWAKNRRAHFLVKAQ